MCRWSRRPCLGLAGVVLDAAKAGQQFTAVHAIAPDLTSADESRRDAARWLTELARRVARAWR
jgi:glycerate kinase